jgi:hypothetical protein
VDNKGKNIAKGISHCLPLSNCLGIQDCRGCAMAKALRRIDFHIACSPSSLIGIAKEVAER